MRTGVARLLGGHCAIRASNRLASSVNSWATASPLIRQRLSRKRSLAITSSGRGRPVPGSCRGNDLGRPLIYLQKTSIFAGDLQVNRWQCCLMANESSAAYRRSPCPVACALEILGDKWTLLVVRDLMLGRSRFKEFMDSLEGIPTNILADRLVRLERHGAVEKRPVPSGVRRHTYHLTEKGEALRSVIRSLVDWGLDYEEGTEAGLEPSV